MKRLFFLTLSLMCMFSFCCAQTTDDEKYEQANRYYETKEYDKAIPILNELNSKNHACAINLLGICYNYGYGVIKDLKKAVEYYQKSADIGCEGAQRNLGICYERGIGVDVNKEAAYSWYEKAFRQYKDRADNGDADAQCEVGKYYYWGRMRDGVNYAKAIPWFEKSANQGNASACNFLGLIYHYGEGVEKNVDKAYEYYLQGAEKGNCYAQRNLAWLFQEDEFIEIHSSSDSQSYHQDFDFDKQTEKWLRIAAKNNAIYCYDLAYFYYNRIGEVDFPDKYTDKYLEKAAEAGNAKAQAAVGYMEMCEGKYDNALKKFNYAKENEVDTFCTFSLSELSRYEDMSIDGCLTILQYLKNNPDLILEDTKKYDDESYLLLVNKGDERQGLIILSETGSVLAKTPFFYHIYPHEDCISFSYTNDSDSERCYVRFSNNRIQFEMMDGIYHFLQQNKSYIITDACNNGGDYLYIVVRNDKKQYSYMKINKAGNIIKSTPFINDYLSISCSEENISLPFPSNDICFIDSKPDLDIVFTVLEFFLTNTYYKIKDWDAVSINNNCLLIRAVKNNDDKYKTKWFKLSPTGTILGTTTTERDDAIYYSSNEKKFIYSKYDSVNRSNERLEFSLQEMLNLFK